MKKIFKVFLFTAIIVVTIPRFALSMNRPAGAGNIPLPVLFIDMSGKYTGAGNELSWTTDGEEDSTYYEIQRSTDGYVFLPIGIVKVDGAPGNKKTYRFTDVNADNQLNSCYYRIGVGELNGIISYSKTVKIVSPVNDFFAEVSSNPFASQLSLRITAAKPSVVKIQLVDRSGRTLVKTSSPIINGITQIDLAHTVSLAQGHYILSVWNDETRHTVNLIKK